MAVLLATGCGGGANASRARACSALDIPPAVDSAEAGTAIQNAIAADRQALATLDVGDPLTARFRGAKARAEQALASFTRDSLDSLSMSPGATILPTARRVVAETHALRNQLCR